MMTNNPEGTKMNQMDYYERMAKSQMRTALSELRNDAGAMIRALDDGRYPPMVLRATTFANLVDAHARFRIVTALREEDTPEAQLMRVERWIQENAR